MSINLRDDGEHIYINTAYAEAYIPESFFTMNKNKTEIGNTLALEYGDGFQLIGIFNMRFYPSKETPRDKAPVFTFIYPNMIETYPSSSITMRLNIDGSEDRYRVLQYDYNDILCNADTTKSVTNCEKFVSLITTGKIPRSLGYDDILKIWLKNFEINGIAPAVPAVVLQAIISEMCRSKTNPANSFRFEAGSDPNIDMKSYRPVNLNAVTSYSSVASALSFERIGEKLTTSFIMSYENTPQRRSPMEEVITM